MKVRWEQQAFDGLEAPRKRRKPSMECEVEECRNLVQSRGLCSKHYARLRKYGDPLAGGPFRSLPTCPNGHPQRVIRNKVLACSICEYEQKRGKPRPEFSSTPCHRCGGPKPFGGGRKLCDDCRIITARDTHLARFGINGEDYEDLFEYQGRCCAICGNKPSKKRLAVDHDHDNGGVRGLLCDFCNQRILGGARDSVEILRRAIAYLEDPPAPHCFDKYIEQ